MVRARQALLSLQLRWHVWQGDGHRYIAKDVDGTLLNQLNTLTSETLSI